jgi:hypothetical protein
VETEAEGEVVEVRLVLRGIFSCLIHSFFKDEANSCSSVSEGGAVDFFSADLSITCSFRKSRRYEMSSKQWKKNREITKTIQMTEKRGKKLTKQKLTFLLQCCDQRLLNLGTKERKDKEVRRTNKETVLEAHEPVQISMF